MDEEIEEDGEDDADAFERETDVNEVKREPGLWKTPGWTDGDFGWDGARMHGTLIHWSYERGFGLIQPSDGGHTLLVHVSRLEHGPGSVHKGDEVTFVRQFDRRKGVWLAADVELSKEGLEVESERNSGTVVTWNDERGYGFIKPDEGSENIFCHVSGFVDPFFIPQVGDAVTYKIQVNTTTEATQAREIRCEGQDENNPWGIPPDMSAD